MKTIFKCFSLVCALAVFSPSIGASDNPLIGKWTLDVAKSTFNPDPAPKSGTRMYESSPEGIVMTEVLVGPDGKETKRVFTIKEDGNSHPFTDSDDFDAIKAKKINDRETHFIITKGVQRVETVTRVLSKDGRTLSLHFVGNENGAKVDVKLFYKRASP